jgi:hypothetical protein
MSNIYRGNGYELRGEDGELLKQAPLREPYWQLPRPLNPPDNTQELINQTKLDNELLAQKVVNQKREHDEREIVDTRPPYPVRNEADVISKFNQFKPAKINLDEQVQEQYAHDALQCILEVNRLLKNGLFFAAEKRIGRPLTDEEKGRRSLGGELVPLVNSGFSFVPTGRESSNPFLPFIKPPSAGVPIPQAPALENQGAYIEPTADEQEIDEKQLEDEKVVNVEIPMIPQVHVPGGATDKEIIDMIESNIRIPDNFFDGKPTPTSTGFLITNNTLMRVLKHFNLPTSGSRIKLVKRIYNENARMIGTTSTLPTQSGGGLNYGLKSSAHNKYALYGPYAINLQKLNMEQPILSLVYARSNAKVVHFKNQRVSPAFRVALKSVILGNSPNLKGLAGDMKDLLKRLIERSGKGHDRTRVNRVEPINPKLITPVFTNIKDPKARMMILLGSYEAGDDLNSSERMEVQELARLLLTRSEINKEQYSRICQSIAL